MFEMGLLVLRVCIGALLVGHGLQKLVGWFGGPGVGGNASFLASLGYRRPRTMAWLHGAAETAAGLSLALGLLTPFGAALAIAVLLNAAVAVHGPKGLWVQNGGYEYPVVLGVIAATLTMTGPGRLSFDAALGLTVTTSWAVGVIVAGLVVGTIALTVLRDTDTGAASGSSTVAGDRDDRPRLVDAA